MVPVELLILTAVGGFIAGGLFSILAKSLYSLVIEAVQRFGPWTEVKPQGED